MNRDAVIKRLDKLDTDEDGVVSEDEMKSGNHGIGLKKEELLRFAWADTDGAPGLSKEEYLAWSNPELSTRKNEYELWDAQQILISGDADKSSGLTFKEYYALTDHEITHANALDEMQDTAENKHARKRVEDLIQQSVDFKASTDFGDAEITFLAHDQDGNGELGKLELQSMLFPTISEDPLLNVNSEVKFILSKCAGEGSKSFTLGQAQQHPEYFVRKMSERTNYEL
jgi:hypothetical protein